MKILLKNAQVVTLNDRNEVLYNTSIGISGKTIDYMGEAKPELEKGYDRIIDCKGKTLMPGFVNAHNHTAMTMFRNYADDLKLMDWLFNKIFPLEDKLTEEAAYWSSKLAIVEMLKSGTTAFSDMYFFMDRTAEAIGESGIRAVIARGLQGDTGVEDLDYRMKENLELYTRYNNSFDGRIKVMLGPHAVYTCSMPYLQKVAYYAKEHNISIQTHISETRDEVRNCMEKYGKSPVKLLDEAGILCDTTIGAHCVIVDDEDIDILAQRGVHIIHNPGSNMKLASGVAPVTKMLQKGINVALGTDGASSNNNLDMLEEMRMATYMQKVFLEDPTALPVDQVLRMATVNGAKAMGYEDAGSLEVGMKADIIILDTEKAQYYPKYNIKSAIVYSGSSADVETVIVDGKILMEKGTILTLDEERVLYEMQKWADKLTK